MEDGSKFSPRKHNFYSQFNILILGTKEVGKSSLFKHFIQNGLPPMREESLAVSFGVTFYQTEQKEVKL
jgi:hypothetical protein